MKSCPFCAETIQQAAIVCRFCGRDLPGVIPPREGGSTATARPVRVAEIVLGVAAVVVAAYAVMGGKSIFGGTAASNLLLDPISAPPPPPPQIVHVADEGRFAIGPGEYHTFPFEVDDTRPCVLTGRVLGLRGGNHDIDVYLLDEDAWINWQHGTRGGHVVFQSGRTAASTLDVPLPGPGRYHLLVSNVFSMFTGKAVEVGQTVVTCG